MKSRTLWGSLLALLAGVAIIFGVSSPATAAAPDPGVSCDGMIEDTVGVVKQQDITKIAASADKVTNEGAVVHVFIVDSVAGYGNSLDKLEHSVEAACPSWQAADGGRKNNLVVVAVSMKPHLAGIYAGAQWNRSVGQDADKIRAEQMNPKFRDGDFAQGLVDGLDAIGNSIDNQLHPKPVEPAKPMDLSWLLWAIMSIIGAMLLILSFAFGGRAISRSRQQKANRLAMQQRAIQARAELENNVYELSSLEGELEERATLLPKGLSASDLSPVRAALDEFHAAFAQVTAKYGSIQAQDPAAKLVASSYEQISVTANEGNKAAEQTHSASRKVIQAVESLEQMVSAMPDQVQQAKQSFASAQKEVSSSQALIQQLQTEYAAGCSAYVKNHPQRVEQLITKVSGLLSQAEKAVTSQEWSKAASLLKQQQELLQEVGKLGSEVHNLAAALKEAKQNSAHGAEKILQKVEEVRQYVSEHCSEVDNVSSELRVAIKRVSDAKRELAKAQPDYVRVTKTLQDGRQTVDSAFAKVTSQYKKAERERAEAARKLAEAKRKLDKAREYAKKHPSRMCSSTKNRIDEAERLYAQAQSSNDLTQFMLMTQLISAASDAERDAHRDYSSYGSSYSSYGGSSGGSSSSGYSGGSDSSSSWGSSFGSDSSGGWGSSGGTDSSGGW